MSEPSSWRRYCRMSVAAPFARTSSSNSCPPPGDTSVIGRSLTRKPAGRSAGSPSQFRYAALVRSTRPSGAQHRHRHRCLLEGDGELRLALLEVVLGPCLLDLGQPPGDHLERRRGQHRQAVQQGPAPRMDHRIVVVVRVVAHQGAEHRVVQRGGHQEDTERRPVPVEGERGDRDEEGEVGLGQAAGHRHEAAAGDGEADRHEDRREPARPEHHRGHHAGQDQQDDDQPGAVELAPPARRTASARPRSRPVAR